MGLENINAAQYITGKLRQNLTDYNASTRAANFGNWIFPDRPMLMKLIANKNNFPRISIEQGNISTLDEIGFECTDMEEIVTLTVNIWTMRELLCEVSRTTDETHTYIDGTSVYALANLPASNIVSILPYIKNTDYKLIDNDQDGFYDSVEWIGAHPADGINFDVTYTRDASADELVRIIANDIHKYLRENWREWTGLPLYEYSVGSNRPIPYDENINVHRRELEVRFKGINIGEMI